MLRSALLLLPFFYQVSADPWVCATNVTTLNPTMPTWVPAAYQNSTQGALPYASQQDCSYVFNIPNGQYALVQVDMSLNKGDVFVIMTGNGLPYQHSFNGDSGDLMPKGPYTFYVPAGNATIRLVAHDKQSNATFSFFALLNKLPTWKSVQVDQSKPTQTFPLNSIVQKQYYFNSTNSYTFRVIMADCNFNQYGYDNCLVYRGANAATGTFEAGLSSYLSGIPTAFKGETSVICFDVIPVNSLLLYTPMPEIDKLFMWYSVLVSACNGIWATASSTIPSYVTTYCPKGCTQYLNDIAYEDDQTKLSIYNGVPGTQDYGFWTTMGRADAAVSLPQQINGGVWKTFVARGGGVALTMGDSSRWSQASKRKGFFATPNYNTYSSIQNALGLINSTTQYNFKYHVENVFSGQLQVIIQNADGTAMEQFITPSNINTTRDGSANGVRMMINYAMGQPNVTASYGAFMSFEISDATSAATYSIVTVLALLAILIS